MAAVMNDTEAWEYAHVQAPTNLAAELVKTLNNLGVEGWQLVTMDDVDRTLGLNTLTAIVKRRIVPLEPPENLEEGWYQDPAGRFDLRLWNGEAWTFSVARKADKSVHRDPPTSRTPTPDLKQ